MLNCLKGRQKGIGKNRTTAIYFVTKQKITYKQVMLSAEPGRLFTKRYEYQRPPKKLLNLCNDW